MAGFRVARILGIDIELHWTWFIILGFIAWALSTGLFPRVFPEMNKFLCWFWGIFTTLTFFASLLFHEMAHSLVARYFKIRVKRITLFIFGGAAQLENGDLPASRIEFWIAIAGPLSSFLLAASFWFIRYGIANFSPPLALGLYYLAFVNALLAVFNLLPAFPLDGGRIFRAALWSLKKDLTLATRIAYHVGQAVSFLIILGGLVLMLWGHAFSDGLWLIIIGWVISSASKNSWHYYKLHKSLGGVKVKDLFEKTTPSPAFLNKAKKKNWVCQPEEDALKVYEKMVSSRAPALLVLGEREELLGLITFQNILSRGLELK